MPCLFFQFVTFLGLEWLLFLAHSLEPLQVMFNLFVMLWKSHTLKPDGTTGSKEMSTLSICILTLQH